MPFPIPYPPEAIDQLLNRLVGGDQNALWIQAEALQADGWTFAEIMICLIDPLLHEVGERWAAGGLTVAHEHVVTAICQQVIGQLRRAGVSAPHARAPVAIVGCGPDERHGIGAEIVAGALQSAGWRTIYLGPDTPSAGFVAIVEEWMARLVAISVATPASVPAAAELVNQIKAGDPSRRVVVGGGAAELRFFPQADLVTGRDLLELLNVAATWR